MKQLFWCGDSRERVCDFPESARIAAGHQLNRVQQGREPEDWKPMSSVGSGVREIRIHEMGEFRVLYVSKLAEAIYVLHAFQKKAQQTSQRDIALAESRFRALMNEQRRRLL